MKSKISTKDIATGGISAALSFLFATGAVYIDALTITLSVLSAAALMLPLSRGRYVGGLLAYAATSGLLMLTASPLKSLPYVVIFGGYTLFCCITEDKRWNKIVVYALKVLWINAALALFYFGTKTLVINFDKLGFELKYGYLAVLTTALGIIYDFALRYLYRMVKSLKERYLEKSAPSDMQN